MFKKLFYSLVAVVGLSLGLAQAQTAVQTPTLQGTYQWSGTDTWTFGNLGFTTTPPQCPVNQVMNGFTATFGANCVPTVQQYTEGFSNNVGSGGLTSGAVKVTLATSTSGYSTQGCGYIDSEYMCYATLDVDGLSLDGVQRGMYGTAAASHAANALWTSVITAFSPNNQVPGVVIFGNGSQGTISINNPFITPSNPQVILQVNAGSNETYIGVNGVIVQRNLTTCCDIFDEVEIGTTDAPSPHSQDFITNAHNVMQITNQYETQQPIGFGGGVAGGVTFSQPATIAAPTFFPNTGSTAYSYICQDHAGLVPGTVGTWLGPASVGFVTVECPRQAGVAAYDIYRTAGGTNTGIVASNVLPGTSFNDNPAVGASGGSIVGSNTSQTFINGLTFLSANDLFDLNLATSTNPICVDTNHKLTQSGCTTASALSLSCTAGISCTLVGSVWNVTASGGAGSGAVNAANFGQQGTWGTTGGITTVGGAQGLYSLNPNWSLSQMNALFSRFNSVNITSWSITSNVATFQAVNSYSTGDVPALINFPTSTFFNNVFATVIATGLSNTQFEVAFTHANGSATETGNATLVEPAVGNYQFGTVVVPAGLIDQPSNAYTNTAAQVQDTRHGYMFDPISKYGIKCDANIYNLTITAGTNSVSVGADFPGNVNPIGMTATIAKQVSFGQNGTQEDWEPTIASYPSGTSITFSSTPPFSYSGPVVIGTNNQARLQAAVNDEGGIFPLYIPTGCRMLSDTVRWTGTSFIGQQMNYTGFFNFPGHDMFQQQDGTPITAWSINSSTGVTTFTINAYSSHNILVGDVVDLKNFGTSTFFNNINATIASQPTPTTFTVNSAFGRSSSSGTEAGLAAPTTGANTNGLRMENHSYWVDNRIDGSYPWNHYDPNTAALTVEPAYYRASQEFGQPANNPFGPAWGLGTVNGVSTIVQNSAVVCTSTTAVGGHTPRVPAVGTTIVLPYQGSGAITRSVISTAGSCSGSLTPVTLNSALPNTSAFTSSQAEWFTYATPQTLAVALPGSITFPTTITAALPVNIIPGFESNASSHGALEIGPDRFEYMGVTYSQSANTATFTLRTGTTTPNSGSGDAIGSVIFPMNPCSAMANAPYPVVPTLNTGAATPLYAIYYAGACGGSAAISFPAADADAWTPFGNDGLSLSYWNNVGMNNLTTNSLGNADNAGTMGLWEQGNNTGYGNTLNALRIVGLWGGFIQGPASVNQDGVGTVGPTSTGQSISNCTMRTGYGIILDNFQQSNIDRCDTYSTETSPYDGTSVGASTGLYMVGTLSEQTGSGITFVNQITVKDYNNEPEGGNHDEFAAAMESDGTTINWIGTILEGGFNLIGGRYQIFHGTQISNPSFNYGSNNYFEHMFGLNSGLFVTGPYNNTTSFFNWGVFTQGECSNGSSGAANTLCFPGSVQGYNGHDAFATMMGNLVHPSENLLGGMIVPGEWTSGNGMTTGITFDATELYWGSHSECALTTSTDCVVQQFDGPSGYIVIGPHQRITDTQYVLKANVKTSNAGTFTFSILISAQNATGTCSSPNFSLATANFTATNSGWTPIQMPIDFSTYAGCSLGVQFYNANSTNVLQVGYFNFVPFPGQLYIPLGTHTVGGSCPVAGEISLDSAHLWTCSPTSGVQFGAGTWQQH